MQGENFVDETAPGDEFCILWHSTVSIIDQQRNQEILLGAICKNT